MSAAEHQVLLNAILVGRVDRGRAAEVPSALGILGLAQMPPAGARAHDFPAGRNLEPLGHGLLRSDTFGTSHNCFSFVSKRARNIGIGVAGIKSYFCRIWLAQHPRSRLVLRLLGVSFQACLEFWAAVAGHSAFCILPSALAPGWLWGSFVGALRWLCWSLRVALR